MLRTFSPNDSLIFFYLSLPFFPPPPFSFFRCLVKFKDPDFVVPTLDTVRHDDVLESWILMRRPIILCGPPGSGKTMTLKGVLKSSSGFQVRFLTVDMFSLGFFLSPPFPPSIYLSVSAFLMLLIRREHLTYNLSVHSLLSCICFSIFCAG